MVKIKFCDPCQARLFSCHVLSCPRARVQPPVRSCESMVSQIIFLDRICHRVVLINRSGRSGDWKPTVNWAKCGKLRCRSNQNNSRFPCPCTEYPLEYDGSLEYDDFVVCVDSVVCVRFRRVLSQLSHKFQLTYPYSIILLPARRNPGRKILGTSTGLNYLNFMECDSMRDCSKRWKNNDFPHIPYYQIPRLFSRKRKKRKKTSAGSFFVFFFFFLFFRFFRFLRYALPSVEYDDFWVCAPSTMISEYARRVRWFLSMRAEYDMRAECDVTRGVRWFLTMRGGNKPQHPQIPPNSPDGKKRRHVISRSHWTKESNNIW